MALTDIENELFRELVKMSQKGLLKTLSSYLEAKYPKDQVITTDSYVYAAGDIPIALVAHLDTVFKIPPHDIYYDREANVMFSPDGLGADDRAGVFAIVKLIGKGYCPSVIFTTDEEIGGRGALEFAHDVTSPITPVNYLIELDRAGADDCVFYDCYNPDFITYIEGFGFQMQMGSFSDISFICPLWEIAGVNLSIGYENEHSTAEILNFNYLFDTLKRVEKMLTTSSPAFMYIPTHPGPNYTKIIAHRNAVENGELEYEEICPKCGKYSTDMWGVWTLKETIEHWCSDCAILTEFCDSCGCIYEVDLNDIDTAPHFCSYCKSLLLEGEK